MKPKSNSRHACILVILLMNYDPNSATRDSIHATSSCTCEHDHAPTYATCNKPSEMHRDGSHPLRPENCHMRYYFLCAGGRVPECAKANYAPVRSDAGANYPQPAKIHAR